MGASWWRLHLNWALKDTDNLDRRKNQGEGPLQRGERMSAGSMSGGTPGKSNQLGNCG